MMKSAIGTGSRDVSRIDAVFGFILLAYSSANT